ncbi:hypothetical protein PIB30_088307 [Stylosanthes scabra]|uniref:Uncharacterized protein n=1 Tax=Stylosanthes scabra TaxID=79078 RepID=A0ABU6XUS7_9FABA|nr:hypothetical protein [Stylosanthes scabra]
MAGTAVCRVLNGGDGIRLHTVSNSHQTRELSASIIMDGQDGVLGRLWFVDDVDNCVRMRLWRERAIIYTSGNDVRRLVSLTIERTDVGIQIQHLDQRVYSAQILTNDFMPLEPFQNDRYYAGCNTPKLTNQVANMFDQFRSATDRQT